MREIMKKAAALAMLGMALLFSRCGSRTEVAGGSGAGNPGGAVSVAMSVQLLPATAKTTAAVIAAKEDGRR